MGAKKYCEKDGTKGLSKVKNADGSLAHPMKKTWYDACVVGDTVGDPFKDISGPALNILIKLMSMVSLTIAPTIAGNKDWENWYFGMVPFAVFALITAVLVFKKVLTWKDPLDQLSKEDTKGAEVTTGVVPDVVDVDQPEKVPAAKEENMGAPPDSKESEP